MKKLTLFLVASVMLSSTFLSASCGDDDDEVKPEEIVDEWLSDKAVESNDSNDIEQEIIRVAESILLKYEKAFLELAK